MADTVQTNILFPGTRRRIIQLINISDGTGESDVVKVDVSAIGAGYSQVIIEEVEWAIQGFSSVRIEFDATTDDEGLVLPTGIGYKNFRPAGGLKDPRSSGATGDLLLTTAGNVSGATYDITLSVILIP